MADEEKEVEASAEQPKKKSPIILIVVLVIVGLVLAVGISTFVMKQMMEGAGEEEFDENESRHHDAGVFLKLGDPKEGILVNVGGPRAGKYLKAGIVLEMNPGKKSVINEETKSFNPDAEIKVMDITTQFLRALPIEEYDAQKQNDLKKQLKEALNAELGNGAVYDVYITSFLLQ